MGVTVKQKVKVAGTKVTKLKAVAVTGTYTDEKQRVDRLADLQKQINTLMAKMEPLSAEASLIVADLKGRAETELPASQEAVFEGSEFNYEVSKKAMKTHVPDMKDVRKAMGDKTFMEVASVSVTDLKKYLTEKDLDTLIVQTRDGSRSGKLVPIK